MRLLIWIAGPRHACVNFPQTEYTAFVPNQPTATYLLPVADSKSFMLDLMPPAEKAKIQFQISYQLAGLRFDQMLDYADNFQGDGVDARAREIVASYKQKLDITITAEINRRNQERQRLGLLPYPYFLPKNIPNGTSVWRQERALSDRAMVQQGLLACRVLLSGRTLRQQRRIIRGEPWGLLLKPIVVAGPGPWAFSPRT